MSLLKLSLLSLGLFVGANWSYVFIPWSLELLALFGVTTVYLLYVVWLKR